MSYLSDSPITCACLAYPTSHPQAELPKLVYGLLDHSVLSTNRFRVGIGFITPEVQMERKELTRTDYLHYTILISQRFVTFVCLKVLL